MPNYRRDYAASLDGLRMLAQRDLLAWWKRTEGLGFIAQKELLVEPFAAVVQAYGEQAAYSAADYLFLDRSLDDTLRELEYPEVADPAGFAQAQAAYKSAMWVDDVDDAEARALALQKLQGITNRLVVAPARETVARAVITAGTRYARVPEPGACAFCLMLGSRGAVYSKDSVLGEVRRYHDNCRCLAIEVKEDSDLPQINRDLAQLSQTLNKEFGRSATVNDWRQCITARRQQAGQDVEWPRLQYCRIPQYTGDGMSAVFPGEKLPPLGKMPGHVLYGWRDHPGRDGQGWPHDESLADGHRWDSQRPGASTFPKEWTDQQIVDAVRDTLEHPTHFRAATVRRTVWREIDGLTVRAEYNVRPDGKIAFRTAFPVEDVPKGAEVAK
ncbi:VG15 protein [Corynebacterium phoceense]